MVKYILAVARLIRYKAPLPSHLAPLRVTLVCMYVKSYMAKKPIKAQQEPRKNTKNWINGILKGKFSHAHEMSKKAIQRKKSKVKEKQGRIHDCSCRGRLGRGSNDLGRGSNDLDRGSNDLGRGKLKYKLFNP